MNKLLTLSALGALLVSAGVIVPGCPGPERTECTACGYIYCSGGSVVECDCYDDYPNGGYGQRIAMVEECGADTTCVVTSEGTGEEYRDGFFAGEAECVDSCDSIGSTECRGQGDAARWLACAPSSATFSELEAMVVTSVETPGDVGTPATSGQVVDWQDTGLACIACESSCGCDRGSYCLNGYCLEGSADQDLVCCGRERETPCSANAACENIDGSMGTCETVGRCETCDTIADCEDTACSAVSESSAAVCLSTVESLELTAACREDLDEVWDQDACGRFIQLNEDCTELGAFRCEVSACVENVPEIEVSPTLLDFGDVAMNSSADLTLSIGNIGFARLDVTSVEVDETSADLFTLSAAPTTVEVDDIESVTVTFTPTAVGDVSNRITISSNDQDESEVTVLLNGTGVP